MFEEKRLLPEEKREDRQDWQDKLSWILVMLGC